MSQINLHLDMGGAVLEHLRQFAELPNRGVVAGQAVASAVSQLFGDGRIDVYNDIDVFVPAGSKAEFKLEKMRSNRSNAALGTCDFSEPDDGYGGWHYSSLATTYKVARTSRDGMLNLVECVFSSKANAGHLVRSFDMNNVQVGVDLRTQKLIWTSAFADFMHSYQLELVRLHTPMHSLVRYFTKKSELNGVYGNDARMVELVAAAYQLIRSPKLAPRADETGTGRLAHRCQWKLGERYQRKLNAVHNLVAPHFSMDFHEVDGYEVAELMPRFEVPSDLMCASPVDFIHELPLLSKALREKHTAAQQARIQHLLAKSSKDSVVRQFWMAEGMSFLRGNTTVKEMDRADRLLKEHDIAMHVKAPRLDETLARVKFLRGAAKARGDWVYGWLETSPPTLSLDKIEEGLDSYIEWARNMAVTPVLGDVTLNEYLAKELTNGCELLQEGAQMHHCVGGYAQVYAAGNDRVFSLRKPGSKPTEWLTTHYSLDARGNWWLPSQSKGVVNRAVTAGEKEVLMRHAIILNAATVLGARQVRAVLRLPPATAFWVLRSTVKAAIALQAVAPGSLSEKLAEMLDLPRYWDGWSSRSLRYWRGVAVSLIKGERPRGARDLRKFAGEQPIPF